MIRQSHILDTKVLERAGLPSIVSILLKSCLRWSGHVIRMDDSRLPNQLFFGEMCEGKRKASKPKKRFKGSVKICLKQCCISVDQWEKMALDRSQRCKLIHVGIETFENSRVQYVVYKRSVRKGRYKDQHQIYKATMSTVKYVKNCFSLAGLKSQMCKHV